MMHYLKDLFRLYACISPLPHLCNAQHGEVFLCDLFKSAIVENKRLSGADEGDFRCVRYSESLSQADIALAHRNMAVSITKH
jgi:hypothetical protein